MRWSWRHIALLTAAAALAAAWLALAARSVDRRLPASRPAAAPACPWRRRASIRPAEPVAAVHRRRRIPAVAAASLCPLHHRRQLRGGAGRWRWWGGNFGNPGGTGGPNVEIPGLLPRSAAGPKRQSRRNHCRVPRHPGPQRRRCLRRRSQQHGRRLLQAAGTERARLPAVAARHRAVRPACSTKMARGSAAALGPAQPGLRDLSLAQAVVDRPEAEHRAAIRADPGAYRACPRRHQGRRRSGCDGG